MECALLLLGVSPIMKEKVEESVQIRPAPGFAPPILAKAFKKNGLYDGKLFHSEDKVTYTFLTDQEVVSLHFDLKSGAIFYKGHKLENFELAPEQKQHLQQFLKVLEKPETAVFAKAYQKAFDHYLQRFSK